MESKINSPGVLLLPDFQDTKTAFSNRSDKELKFIYWLFSIMNKTWLVNLGSHVGLFAAKWNLPLFKMAVKKTMFYHFCGGEDLEDSKAIIDHMYRYNVTSILDYGAEAKSTPEELDFVADQFKRTIEFAGGYDAVSVVSIKVTGIASNTVLEKMQQKGDFTTEDEAASQRMWKRLHDICKLGAENKVKIYVDAEESWIQDAIDDIVYKLMETYNRENSIVYTTYQLYRHDKLAQLKNDHATAKEKGYILGAKLVRGAYMEKERIHAEEMGNTSPIHPNKEAVDRDYNEAIMYCLQHIEDISLCCATHNIKSSQLMAEQIVALKLKRNHPHLHFSQLLGMSDFITYNLAATGFNVSKLIPYGPVRDVIPYLIRRAQENSSVTGEMSRELDVVVREMKRRGIK